MLGAPPPIITPITTTPSNHNDVSEPLQDPAQWPSVANATRIANLFRYQLLPHLYSLHFRAALFGGTVVRPVFFEFPNDPVTHTLSHQFMWGSSILVVPVINAVGRAPSPDNCITQNVTTVRGYLPPQAQWYSMTTAHKYGQLMPGGYSTFNAPRDTPLPAFVRGRSGETN